MGLQNTVKRFMNKTAYHWYDAIPDGKGRFTFQGIQELEVRWKWTSQTVTDYNGEQVNVDAEVWAYQEIKPQDMLKLADSGGDVPSSSTEALEQGAYEVQSIETIDNLDGDTTIMWKAFL